MVDFSKSRLYGVQSKKVLSKLLKIDLYKLDDIDKYYFTPLFKKEFPNGKVRDLYNPSKEYKRILNRTNLLLQEIVPPAYVFGGVKNRDYILNASIHKGNSFFLLLDIENFFPSTNGYNVYTFFRYKLNMSKDVAKILMLLTTEPNPDDPKRRHLPQGYPTSPYLSFLSYFDMYNGIYSIASKNKIIFSCYYDDLTFSSPFFISKGFKKRVISIIECYGLKVNRKKTRFIKNNHGLKVTGAVIADDQLRAPNRLQHKMFNYFQELMNAYVNGTHDAATLIKLCNKVQGCISAIRSIEKGRNFPYISKRIKEIRKYAKEKL